MIGVRDPEKGDNPELSRGSNLITPDLEIRKPSQLQAEGATAEETGNMRRPAHCALPQTAALPRLFWVITEASPLPNSHAKREPYPPSAQESLLLPLP